MTYHKLIERIWSRFIPISFVFQQSDIGINK